MNIVKFTLDKSLLMNLLVTALLAIGIFEVLDMRREAFPAVDFDIVSVSTIYPGASPRDVENDITDPLERSIKGIVGIKEYNSSSVEGLSLIVIKLDPDLNENDKNTTVDDIQRAIQNAKDLPKDLLEQPKVIQQTSGRFPVIEVSLSGALDYQKLHEIADGMIKRLEDISTVSSLEINGWRDPEYWIEISPDTLRRLNLSFSQVMQSIATQNLNLPGGTIVTAEGEVLVRTVGQVHSIKEIEDIVVRANDTGVVIRIRDIAKVHSTFAEETRSYRTSSQPSINISVSKTTNGDIIKLVDQVKSEAQDYVQELDDAQIKLAFVNDVSNVVRNRLGVLFSNAGMGFVLVLLTLFLMLSRHIALVAAMGVPVALGGALVAMAFAGMTINMITMFAMVIVVGMLVDDAIVVAENIWHHYEEGASPYDATIRGTSEVFWPVTATVLTTISAFIPLLLISGIFGKFISQMPKVVAIALAVSLLECLLVLPSHAYELLKRNERRRDPSKPRRIKSQLKANELTLKEKMGAPFIKYYQRSLEVALRWRWGFAALITAFLTFTLWMAKEKMPLILFPSEGIETFFVRLDLPVGTALHQTAETFEEIENIIKELPSHELSDYVSHIGVQREDSSDPFAQRGTHLGQIMVFLTPVRFRLRTADQIIDELRPIITHKAQELGMSEPAFTRQRTGPPVGKPVAIRVRGDQLEQLDKMAIAIQDELQAYPGVLDIRKNFMPGKDEFQVRIDPAEAARSMLSVRDIANHVRSAFEGQIASYIRDGDERIAVRVRYPEEVRNQLTSLNELTIPNAVNNLVPITRVAHIERRPGINAIFRRDGRRAVTVTADINESQSTSEEVNKRIAPLLKDLAAQNPGNSVTAGGEWEDTAESLSSLARAFVIGAALIYLILATQFNSLTQPFMVMASIPFGIIGVIWTFYLHNLPISFFGFIGTIGLSGVVVNDSIVLVSFINQAIKEGMDPFEAVFAAGKRRFRAVWLTTLTTVLGLVPLVYGIGGEDLFLRPAAAALGYGLIFGTVLVLFFTPALYLMRMDIISALNWPLRKWRGEIA